MPKFSIVLLFVFMSCSKTYKLSKSDLKWNPYKGGELLIFNSNTGDIDTIFVLGVEKEKVDEDPLDFFPNQREVLSVIVKHTRPIPPNNYERMEDSFFGITAAEENTNIDFRLYARNAWFYADSYFISELNKLAETTLVTTNNAYDDVIILEPQENIKKEYLDERDEFVTKIYWSKSKGYIRYDLKNGVYWELQ